MPARLIAQGWRRRITYCIAIVDDFAVLLSRAICNDGKQPKSADQRRSEWSPRHKRLHFGWSAFSSLQKCKNIRSVPDSKCPSDSWALRPSARPALLVQPARQIAGVALAPGTLVRALRAAQH